MTTVGTAEARQPFGSSVLSGYSWYRRLCGGKWEGWYIDHPVCGTLWLRVTAWTPEGARPDPLARGTPARETYGTKS